VAMFNIKCAKCETGELKERQKRNLKRSNEKNSAIFFCAVPSALSGRRIFLVFFKTKKCRQWH